MKNIITPTLLSKAASDFVEKRGSETILAANSKGATGTARVSIFLSHKHSDRALVEKVIALFQSLGVSVYVDWLDVTIPAVTSPLTAKHLKDKIHSNKKFILLATDEAIASKWCNWELGLGDAAKYLKDIALLPINPSWDTWKGSEYLGIYPVITSNYTFVAGSYSVDFAGVSTPLTTWLQS